MGRADRQALRHRRQNRGDGGQRFRDGSDDVSHVALVDRKAGDLRIETAMCKMWATETTWRIADEAMQVRGGRGYETAQSLAGRGEPIAVERFLRDCRINMIFEGSSEIMRLFIAREALDPHLKVGGAIFNTQLPMSIARKPFSVPENFTPAGIRNSGWRRTRGQDLDNLHADLRPHVNYAARTSKKLARGLFHAMARFGPKLDREQLLLSRFVGIATDFSRSARPVRTRNG
jgi:hypothetical protein